VAYYIKAALDGKASGTQIVLTATVDGVDLVAVGWKQSRTSDQFFIATRGVCSTRPDSSKPHVQTWLDANGNRCYREIPQSRVASLYFKGNNVIDVHNQNRQGTLALEKKWNTQDCWFRLFTTLPAGYQMHVFGATCTLARGHVHNRCLEDARLRQAAPPRRRGQEESTHLRRAIGKAAPGQPMGGWRK